MQARATEEQAHDISFPPEKALHDYRSLEMSIRVVTMHKHCLVRCTAKNSDAKHLDIHYAKNFLASRNTLLVRHLDDAKRRLSGLGVLEDMLTFPPPLTIEGMGEYTRCVNREFLDGEGSSLNGRYVDMCWVLDKKQSPSIHIGFASNVNTKQMNAPVVDPRDPTAKPILAFVFSESQTNELAFLFLNGSNETVNIEKPLTQASRIVATAPAIEYTKELFIAGQPSESIAIEAGKVGEWRLPWKTVYELIPETDLAKIKEAGGDLDLVWKVGDYESPPLPISLSTLD